MLKNNQWGKTTLLGKNLPRGGEYLPHTIGQNYPIHRAELPHTWGRTTSQLYITYLLLNY